MMLQYDERDGGDVQHSIAILVVWTIWCERNARIFNEEEKTVHRLVQEIKDTVRLWCTAGAKQMAVLVATQLSE